jgi:hypothetical protein
MAGLVQMPGAVSKSVQLIAFTPPGVTVTADCLMERQIALVPIRLGVF